MMQKTNLEKKAYPIKQLVHWYFGNHCSRKCFDDDTRLQDHAEKLETFANKNPGLKMTHKDFLILFDEQMTVCTLDPTFKQKSISWNLFTALQRIPNYDSSKIIIKSGRLERKDCAIEKPTPGCRICAAHGIR
ncbi:hypothetical protein HY642_00810 [Candidatus Woesearchaeota archaeon]|nr:hypothetical protein [Candidatus Woesearchaeota archaeon]